MQSKRSSMHNNHIILWEKCRSKISFPLMIEKIWEKSCEGGCVNVKVEGRGEGGRYSLEASIPWQIAPGIFHHIHHRHPPTLSSTSMPSAIESLNWHLYLWVGSHEILRFEDLLLKKVEKHFLQIHAHSVIDNIS